MARLSPGIHFPTIKGVKRKVKVLASGKWKFMKMPKGKRRKSKRTRTSNPKKRRVRRIARRRRRRSGGKSLSQQAFKWIRIGALVAPAVDSMMRYGDNATRLKSIQRRYTGWDMDSGEFHFEWAMKGYGPFLLATLFTYGIPKLAGILRRL